MPSGGPRVMAGCGEGCDDVCVTITARESTKNSVRRVARRDRRMYTRAALVATATVCRIARRPLMSAAAAMTPREKFLFDLNGFLVIAACSLPRKS